MMDAFLPTNQFLENKDLDGEKRFKKFKKSKSQSGLHYFSWLQLIRKSWKHLSQLITDLLHIYTQKFIFMNLGGLMISPMFEYDYYIKYDY